jgi:hypothetical protein
LQYEAPLEYELIVKAGGAFSAPTPELIEHIGYMSDNPLFKKAKFRRALILYRQTGLRPNNNQRASKTTFRTSLYYRRIRQNLLKDEI